MVSCEGEDGLNGIDGVDGVDGIDGIGIDPQTETFLFAVAKLALRPSLVL